MNFCFCFLVTRSLELLSLNEVENLFRRLRLSRYVNAIYTNEIDGECLYRCNSMERLVQVGIVAEAKALFLLDKIKEFKEDGVPLEFLSPPPTGLQHLLFHVTKIDIYGRAPMIHVIYDNATMIDLAHMMMQL